MNLSVLPSLTDKCHVLAPPFRESLFEQGFGMAWTNNHFFGTLPPAYAIMRRSYVAMLAIDQIRPLPFRLLFQTFTLRERENEITVISKVCLARHKDDVRTK